MTQPEPTLKSSGITGITQLQVGEKMVGISDLGFVSPCVFFVSRGRRCPLDVSKVILWLRGQEAATQRWGCQVLWKSYHFKDTPFKVKPWNWWWCPKKSISFFKGLHVQFPGIQHHKYWKYGTQKILKSGENWCILLGWRMQQGWSWFLTISTLL